MKLQCPGCICNACYYIDLISTEQMHEFVIKLSKEDRVHVPNIECERLTLPCKFSVFRKFAFSTTSSKVKVRLWSTQYSEPIIQSQDEEMMSWKKVFKNQGSVEGVIRMLRPGYLAHI